MLSIMKKTYITPSAVNIDLCAEEHMLLTLSNKYDTNPDNQFSNHRKKAIVDDLELLFDDEEEEF